MWQRSCRLTFYILLLLGITVVQAQPAPPPQVVFVEDRDIDASSIADPGQDGVTRLADLFRSLGAEVTFQDLEDPFSDEVDLVVVISPSRSLDGAVVARLYDVLERGGNMLLALDPNNQERIRATIRTDTQNRGIDTILQPDYGIGVGSGHIVIPLWASLDTVQTFENMRVLAKPEDFMPHPIIEPLITYDLSISTWAPRAIMTDALGIDATAQPLMFTENSYGESDIRPSQLDLRRNPDPEPLTFEIGEDEQGRLTLGGIGVNLETGSRVAMVGDGEFFQNLFGLARVGNTNFPVHSGNYILLQRLASWLLEIPEDDWVSLPEGFTYIALDGNLSDWVAPTNTDNALDISSLNYDLVRFDAVRNSHFVYVVLETLADVAGDVIVDITLADGQVLRSQEGRMINIATQQPILDSAIALGDGIELRLPRRVFAGETTIDEICLRAPNDLTDCVTNITIRLVDERDLQPVRFDDGRIARVLSQGAVNLRSGPGTDFRIVTTVTNNTQFYPAARDETGEWVQVYNGLITGWMSSSLLFSNIAAADLPLSSDINVE